MLDRISVEGFKSFDSIDLELGQLSVLVGPNGAGKSNFIQVFQLLGAIIRGELELTVGKSGGASTLLHSTSRRADRIAINARFKAKSGFNGYEIVLVPTDSGSLVFERENPYIHDAVKYSHPFNISLGSGHRESRLRTSTEVVSQYVYRGLNSWLVYHFHDTGRLAPMKQKGDVNDNDGLRNNASNLAAFLYRLCESNRNHYDRIVETVRSVAPFFDDFQLRPDRLNEGRIQLEWKQRGSSSFFGPSALSDGTIRFICIATLLLQPEPPSLILLDEPELGLHPFAINLVAEMLEASSQQIIVSTQSVTLLNQLDIGNVLIAEQVSGATTITRPNLGALEGWLDEYGVGEIWEKNLIGGRPIQRS